MWTQSFPNGRKEKFYNPLMQNSSHIKWLKRILPEIDESTFHSIIVFSERCELKKINLTTDLHKVVNRYCLLRVIEESAEVTVLSDYMIETIYQKLYPLTQTTEDERTAHISTITNRINRATKPVHEDFIPRSFNLEDEDDENQIEQEVDFKSADK
jgi:hypothetical protein